MNAFREFNVTSTDTNEDASGFSVVGCRRDAPGARAQGFNGEFFVTEESLELIWPIHEGT